MRRNGVVFVGAKVTLIGVSSVLLVLIKVCLITTHINDLGYIIRNFFHAVFFIVEVIQAPAPCCLEDFGGLGSDSLERKQVVSIVTHFGWCVCKI